MIRNLSPALAAAVAAALPTIVLAAPTTTTVTFENGVNGYAGTTDMRLIQGVNGNPEGSQLGSAVTQYYVDGRVVSGGVATEADVQGLIRFADIIGPGPGQVPAGAYILDAGVRLTTGSATLADTGSRVGVARLLQPFNDASTYSQFGPDGPDYLAGSAAGTTGWLETNVAVDEVRNVRATQIVQAWSDGQANHGLAVQFGVRTNNNNGWQIKTTGADVGQRPGLSVTYVNEPVTVARFQQGVNGYDGTTMAYLQGGTAYTEDFDDLTSDGALLEQSFVDGPNTAASSANDQALIRFDKLFVSQGGTVPDGAEIVQAFVRITTGDGGNSPSGSPWDLSPMLVDWDTTQTFTSFGGDGPDAADGEVGPAADSEIRMLAGSVGQFDITSLVQAWQAGEANRGLNLQSTGSDGWQIHFTGSSVAAARPELSIAYIVPVPEPTGVAALAAAAGLAALRRRRARKA